MLEKTTEAKGGVVPGEFYRTGRWWRRVDDKGDCAQRPSARQRKGTLVAKPHRQDLATAREALMDPATARTGPARQPGSSWRLDQGACPTVGPCSSASIQRNLGLCRSL